MYIGLERNNLDYEDEVQLGVAELEQDELIIERDWDSYYNMEFLEPSAIDVEVEEYLNGK